MYLKECDNQRVGVRENQQLQTLVSMVIELASTSYVGGNRTAENNICMRDELQDDEEVATIQSSYSILLHNDLFASVPLGLKMDC